MKNACVLPDGSIFVYTGLIEMIDTLDELGFVISHELSHVVFRHSSERLTISAIFTIILMLLQLYIFGDVDLSPLTNLLVNLPLSRYAESEADINAIKIMAQVGLELSAGITLMEKFKENEGKNSTEIFQTHPLSEHRASVLKKEILLIKDNQNPSNQKAIRELKRLFKKAKSELSKAKA